MKRILSFLALSALAALAFSAWAQQSTPGQGAGSIAIYQAFPNAALTGSVVETNLAAIRIPANTMGANGAARITASYSYTNNANGKSMNVRIGAQGTTTTGLVYGSFQTTSSGYQFMAIVRNTAVNAQNAFNGGAGFGSTGNPPFVTSIDTSQDWYVNLSVLLAVGTDTITLLGYTVEVLRP